MSSIDSVLFQLKSGLITETSIPQHYLHSREVLDAIQKYNWIVGASLTEGWVDLRRIITYSS